MGSRDGLRRCEVKKISYPAANRTQVPSLSGVQAVQTTQATPLPVFLTYCDTEPVIGNDCYACNYTLAVTN
jgi:hypothetical protein